MPCHGFFSVFALSASLYERQVWVTNTLTFKSSTKTKAHVHRACFLFTLKLH